MKLSIYEIAFKSKYQAKHTDFKQDDQILGQIAHLQNIS